MGECRNHKGFILQLRIKLRENKIDVKPNTNILISHFQHILRKKPNEVNSNTHETQLSEPDTAKYDSPSFLRQMKCIPS